MRSSLLGLVLVVALIAMSGLAYADVAAPLATADGETTGLQVQVKTLKRVGDTLMLQFVLINNSDDSQRMAALLGYYDVSAVSLIDLANKKKYEVIKDAGNN